MADYNACRDAFGPVTTLERQLALMHALKPVNVASMDRIARGGLFRGANRSAMLERSAQVRLRPGLDAIAQAARELSVDVGVVSIGWSREFIHRVVDPTLGSTLTLVHANEIARDDAGVGTGGVDGDLHSGIDKAKSLPRQPILAVGDSSDDLPVLLAARYGAVVRDGSIGRTCAAIGLDVVDWAGELPRSGQLVRVDDLNDVAALLRRIVREDARA